MRCFSAPQSTPTKYWKLLVIDALSFARPAVSNIGPILALVALTLHGIFDTGHHARARVRPGRSGRGRPLALLAGGRVLYWLTTSSRFFKGIRRPALRGPTNIHEQGGKPLP